MESDKKVPTPGRDKNSGIYYLNTRVPADLITSYGKTQVQKSLRTRDRKEAVRKCCEEWLILQKEFDRLRRNLTRNADLTEALIPHLLDEWLYISIRDDEEDRLTGWKTRTDEDRALVLTDFIEDLEQGQRTGKHPDWVLRKAAESLEEKRIRFDTRGIEFKKLVEGLSERYERLFEAQMHRDMGKRVASPEAPQEVVTVSQLYQKYKASRIAENRWKNETVNDKREFGPVVREFIGVVGDKAVTTLTIRDTQKYYEHTIGRQDISLGTKKRNLDRIKAVLRFGKKRCQVPDVIDPLDISTDYERIHKTYERFSKEDLRALFHSADYQENTFKKASQYWLPLLGLYTGARIDEPSSLLVDDIALQEGVWCMHLSTPEANGGGKNKNATRWIPIHPQILNAGFLGYWETVKAEGCRRLFPELGESERDGCSKRATQEFTDYRRSVKVGEMTGKSRKVYHSFRSTFISELTERGVNFEIKRRLVGHAGAGDVHDEDYNQAKFPAERYLQEISKADFGLTHPPFVENDDMRKARHRHRGR